MRNVYPGPQIPHLWVHQTQASARGGNISFEGTKLYSYRACIAEVYAPRKGMSALVLLSDHRYSMTTAKHISHAARAVPDTMRRMYVPYPSIAGDYNSRTDKRKRHRANFDFLTAIAAEMLKEASRAMRSYAVDYRENNARDALDNATFYSAFFGLRRKVPDFPTAAWAAARVRVERIANPDPKSADKRERARAERKQSEYARRRLAEIAHEIGARDYSEMALRSDWRLGGAFNVPGSIYRTEPVMLRVNGDDIETSQGARVPLAVAPMVWQLVEHWRNRGGRVYGTTGLAARVKIGDYPIDSIDADGTLHAGCHHIPHVELRALARALGL